MNNLLWAGVFIILGVLLGLATVPWRYKWGTGGLLMHTAAWACFWPGLVFHIAFIGGVKAYHAAWISYLQEQDRQRHEAASGNQIQ